jgi:uncharacterized membrane protein YhaH (DUF805 family)
VSTWQWYVRRGRIDRRTWWLQYALPLAVLSVLALLADLALGNSDLQELATGQADYGVIVTTVGLLTLPASVSGSATRLHDRGLPAWVLLIVFVPILGQIALLVLTGFVRGEARPNRYGPQPGPPPAPLGDGPLYVPPTWS